MAKSKLIVYMNEAEIIELDIRAAKLRTSRSDVARDLIKFGLCMRKDADLSQLLPIHNPAIEEPLFPIVSEEEKAEFQAFNRPRRLHTEPTISIEQPEEFQMYRDMLSGIGKGEDTFKFNPSNTPPESSAEGGLDTIDSSEDINEDINENE